MDKKGPSDYGTVTEFFFHCLEFSHYCFIPILQFMQDTMQTIDRLKEQRDSISSNHPQCKNDF